MDLGEQYQQLIWISSVKRKPYIAVCIVKCLLFLNEEVLVAPGPSKTSNINCIFSYLLGFIGIYFMKVGRSVVLRVDFAVDLVSFRARRAFPEEVW